MIARRQSLRLRLALGTALAGGTLVVAPAAAQELPSGGNAIVGGVAITTPTPSQMNVALGAPATVINWNTFNVVGTTDGVTGVVTPATVNFSAVAANSTVINRVVTPVASAITNGQITTYATLGDAATKQNTSVWLLNPNGVLVGGASVIDTGSFMGSTLDVCAAGTCTPGEIASLTLALGTNAPLRLFGAAASTTAVSVRDTSRIGTSDALVLVGGAVEVQPGTTLDAAGDVHLVAATDVQVRRAGSPLVFQIDRGSSVNGTLISTGGTITGDTVVVAAARPTALAEALLSVGGTVTARGVAAGARGVVLLGGTGSTDPAAVLPDDPTPASVLTVAAGQTGPVGITSTAALAANAQDVLINATGAVTVGGGVSAFGDYRVAGASVALGTAATAVVQSAGGQVRIRTGTGDLTGLGSLELRSNRDGTGADAVTLSSAGAIGFEGSTSIVGGDGTAAGAADIRVGEASSTTVTGFGAITGRSLGRIPAAVGETAPLPLTLYGTTTMGAVSLDRGLDLTVANGGATVGSLTATSITTGVNPLDDTTGTATADSLSITTAGSARFGLAESRTGNVTVTAQDGDVTGLETAGVFGRANLTAATARTADTGILAVTDGDVAVYAGRSSAGALTATGTNGLALLGSVTAGDDVTVLAQTIDATTVQAAAISAAPVPAGAASGTALLHAYRHDATAGAIDLRVGSVSAGTGGAGRPGLDVLLTADAANGTLAATTINADRNVTVVAGSGANGSAAVAGEVRAGRLNGAGAYAVTAGTVALGTAATTIQQSAAGAVTIRSTATDVTGLGTLTLQSGSDGLGNEALTLNANRAIALDPTSRLFAGNGTAAGNADLLVREGATATATGFGQVRARSLGGIPVAPATAPVPLTLYGPTTFGTVELDRSLTLTIANGGGGALGTLTTGAMTVGVNPVDGGSGTAAADALSITTASSARLLSATSRTGSVSITATNGDVTGLFDGTSFGRANLAAAVASTGATPAIADGNVSVYAGRSSGGALTATGTNGLALLGTVTAGNDVTVLAQKVDAATVQAGAVSASPPAAGAASGTALLHAYRHDATAGAVDLRVGSVSAGTGTAARAALDVLLTADATDGTVAATTLNADRNVTVVAGSGANGIATVSGEVRAGRVDGAGAYAVTAGAVTLGTAATTIQQSATGAATIRSTATDIAGLGALTLQSGSDGVGNEALTLNANRAIAFDPASRLFAGNGTAAGNADLLVREGATATATGFGQVRARQLRDALGAPTLTLYGPTTFGTVDLDRSLTLSVVNGPGGEPGTLTTGAMTLGVNPVDGGAGTATADSLLLTTASSARLLSVTSRTGSLSITALDGDVTGLFDGTGFGRANLAAAVASTGATPAIADGNIGVYAGRSSSGVQTATGTNGLALLGTVTAGNDVTVLAQKIDVATVQAGAVSASPPAAGAASGTALLHAYAHDATAGAIDLRVGSASAGAGNAAAPALDVLLTADAPDGTVAAANLSADRNVTVLAGNGANGSALVSGEVRAGRVDTTGAYGVTAGVVTLGNGTTAVEQSSRGAVLIRSTATDIVGAQRLTLRSNSAGLADGTGAAAGTRTLTLDATGTITMALPDGLTVTQRDAVAARLIGGSDAAPRQSAVYVRAASGTPLTLGNVSARALRSIGATPVAADFPDFAARAGSEPLYHDGDIRIGSVDVADSLGIFAYTAGAGGNVLLQVDSARSRTGNVELVASGELRGYQLTAPGGSTPLGVYVGTDVLAGGARADTYSRTALLDDVSAGGFAALETFGGRLRVDTVTTGTALPIADSGISLIAATDLRLTSAVAARGNVLAQASAGSVTGLPSPDNGTATSNFAEVTRIEATDGNVSVRALGTAAGSGLIAAGTLLANSTETPGAAAPARGNVLAEGQLVGVGTATAGFGSLTLTARTGGLTAVNTGVLLGIGSAGTTATITAQAGTLSPLGDGNGSVTVGTLTAGTNALSGGATALAGNVLLRADANVRAGTVESRTGSVEANAIDGNVTGLVSGGVTGRANLTAATARPAIGGTPAVADGTVLVTAGRDSAGTLTATGSNGLALLGTVAAGGNVTILAQAIDAGSAQSTNGAILARAYAPDGTVTGSAAEALVLGTGSAGLGIVLDAPAGSIRAGATGGTLAAGQLRNGTASDLTVTAANSARIGALQSGTGNVTVTAVNGDVTGLPDGLGGFGRATLTAAFAAPASGGSAAVADGNVAVYAGRDSSGALTATGTNGLARLDAVTAGGTVTVLAQAIDALTLDAARGTVAATGYAADGAIPGSATEVLAVGAAGSGLDTTLTAVTGSVRAGLIDAGRLTGSVGDATVDAARNVRLGTAQSGTGSVTVTARDADVTGLASGGGFGRANLFANAATGDVTVYAGRNSGEALTATGTNGLALLGDATAGRNLAVRAQAIDATRLEATGGTVLARAFAGDGAVTGSATEVLAVGDAFSGLGTTLDAPAGSIRVGGVTAGRLTGSVGNAVLQAALDIRAGTVQSLTGNVTATAVDGDITGLLAGGTFGRANFTASAATGDVGLFAGRTSAGALTATGSGGLARLGSVTAGRNLTILAQAIDATRLEATNGTILGRAYAADGAVTGSATEALFVGDAFSGLGTTLTTPVGSVRVFGVTAGRLTGVASDALIDAARNARVGTATSQTGNVTAIARDGDLTGLAAGGSFGRANLTASAAAGDVGAYAGRDTAGALTATGTAGLARLGTLTAGRNVTVRAQAIDATRAEAISGALSARAYAADAAVPGSAGEALVIGEGLSGLATSLTAPAGSVRATTVTAGQLTGSVADATIEAARNIRAGTIRSLTGNVTATAVDGSVTGLPAGGTFGRADFTASAATGDVAIYAGRTPAGALTATGANGLALLGTASAGRNVTVLAQAIDATRLEATNGAVLGRAYAADGTVTGSATEALAVGEALSGLATTLETQAGSIRADAVTAGRLTGSSANAVIQSARNIRAGTLQSLTGNVTATAVDGDLTGLSTGSGFGRANALATAAAGDVALYAGRDAAGALTATGNAGLAQLGTVTAGRNVTIRAQAIDATSAEAVNGSLTAQAYAADASIAGSTGEALILGTGLSGLDTSLTASAGSVRADTVTAGRLSGSVGDLLIDAARNVRLGTGQTATGSVTVAARDGDVTGLLAGADYGRAIVAASASTGDITILAGRSAAGVLTATGANGLALIDTATAGNSVTVGAQAIDATRLEAVNGAITAQAYAADGAVTAGEALIVGETLSGLTTALTTSAGSVRVTTVTAGTLAGGVGDVAIDSALNVRVGTALSQTGDVGVIARGGDLTGLDTGGVFGRALLTASAPTGNVAAYAGRDAAGTPLAIGTAGLALIDTATAGDSVTLGAQAIDATRLEATNGAIAATAYAADGTVAGSAGEALVVGTALSGLGTTFTTTAGSARVDTITAGNLGGGIGDAVIDSAANVRVRTIESLTGSVRATARDGDLTGLANGSGFDRAIVSAGAGDIGLYAGRDAAGVLTATGAGGLVLVDTGTAGRDVTVKAQAIDATRLQATGGAILAQAWAADGAAPATGGEALVVADALSGAGTTLTSFGGSIRSQLVDAALAAGTTGDIAIDAARDVRLGTARSVLGSVAVTARDGAVTGLANATGFDRTILSAGGATGDLSVLAGRDAAGVQTATGSNGLVFIDTATAGRNLTIGAQAIDATTLTADAALAARAFADDGLVAGGAPQSLTVVTATAGQGASLTSAGSVQATAVLAGQRRNGVAGDLAIDAARNVTIDTGISATGNVTVTARDGTVLATALTAAIASTAQGADAAIADGNLSVYAGRDAAGALTATGSNGLAQLGTLTAGNDVTVRAQKIAADIVQAAAVSAAPLAAGAASGTATLVAYGRDASAGAIDLSVGSVNAGTGTAPRRGLDVILAANAAGGTLSATTINADRNVVSTAGDGANGAASITGQVRAGRTDAAGVYAVTAGQVALGTAGAAIEQSASGAVAITSTASDITGLGSLTLQSNSDGTGREALTLRSARGIVLPAESRLFGGTDSAAGTSDIQIVEGAGATLTTFGEVRGRSLGGIPTGAATSPVPVTLYGATTFGTVNLDRSLDLTVATGGGGTLGTLTTGPLTVGRFPATGTADDITIRTSGTALFASVRSLTGGASVTTSGAGQSIVADGAIDAVGAILLNAQQDVTTTTVASSAGRVQIGATDGTASGQTVTASGGAIDVGAGTRAQYTSITARDAVTVGAGTIGVGTATTGTALAMTANGADGGAAGGEALVLGTGNAGTTAALTATIGSVRAATIDAGQVRNGTLGNLTVTAARNVRLETATSGTGNATVTARDGDIAATTLRAAVASAAQGGAAAVADGNVAVYAGRDAAGALTATGSNGLAQLGTVSAGNNVTVLAQKIAAGTVQAADGSAAALATSNASGTATLTAYAHDATTGAVDLSVGTVNAGTGTAARRGLDVLLTANAAGGTLAAATINADRSVAVAAGNGTNGQATVSGQLRAGRIDPAGTYTVRAGAVTLGTAGQAIEQSAAGGTSITATAGGVAGLGTLTLQSNRDGTGAEPLEVRATGGSIVFDPASTIRGGQASASGSNVTLVATGTAANIDVGTLGAVGSTATLTAEGAITTRGALTAGTGALQAGTLITINGTVTAPTLTMQAGDSIVTNGAIGATAATLRTTAGSVTTNAAVAAPTLTVQAGTGITVNGPVTATTATLQAGTGIAINGALSATTANLRAVGRATTTAPITATTLTVQSSQVALGAAVNATTVGLYNQATTANATRLGGAATAGDNAYDLDETELGRISAQTLNIGSGADDTSGQPLNAAWLRQNAEIGRLTIASNTGTTAVRVVGTGTTQTITVNGAVAINGGTGSRTATPRVLQLGGSATSTTGEAGRIAVVNDGAATGPTGSIAAGGGVLDLRAGQILAGKQAFINDVLAPNVDVSRQFISNPNSSLYGAGPNGYLLTGSPVELVTTGQLKLQFSDYAVLQNTSRPGAIPTGVTITGASSATEGAQPLVLRSGTATQANGFALFGKFQPSPSETFFSTQAALLGRTFISNGATSINGVNPSAARVNGCLLASASGGCLASSIAQPTLNVFDVTRDQILRGSDNLVVTFDPLVGSNNEALFGDIAAGDRFDLQRCPDGTVAAQCKQSGDPQQ